MALSALTTVAGAAVCPNSCGTNVWTFAFLLFWVFCGSQKGGSRLRMSEWVAFHSTVFSAINTLWIEWLNFKTLDSKKRRKRPDFFSDWPLPINPVKILIKEHLNDFFERPVCPQPARQLRHHSVCMSRYVNAMVRIVRGVKRKRRNMWDRDFST